MDVTPLEIEAVKLIMPRRHSDVRGFFVETWNRQALGAAGIDIDFVQDNASYSSEQGTIRGLHYQEPPKAQAKLVRVVRGSAFDVAVDIRRASPTFGRYAAATLTAERGEQMFVPVGFAHGFCTLEPDTEVAYKVSGPYAPEHDAGIAWNDPDIGIAWPVNEETPVLSDRDRTLPRLSECKPVF